MGFDPAAFQSSQFHTPGVEAPEETEKPPLTASDDAISGATRSGISRSDAWSLSQWLLIKVGDALMPVFEFNGETLAPNGIEKESIVVQDNQNETQDTCSFIVWGEPPEPGKEIIIAAGTYANRLFGGVVQTITQQPMKPGNPEQWLVDCADWWIRANKKRVFAKYLTFPADEVFRDIVSRFTAGFTMNNVTSPAPNLAPIEFNGDTVERALGQICERIGWDMYIDPHRDFHFFPIETKQARTLSPYRYHYWDLTFREDLAQMRNRVYKKGGGGVTTAQVLAGDLAIPIDVLTWYPTSGPNMRVQVGGMIIPYTAVTGTGLTVPAGAVTHVIPQGTEVGIFVQVDDLVSQARMMALEGGDSDGVHEYTSGTDGRMGEDELIEQATADMEEFNEAALSGSYYAYDPDARSGHVVDIRLPYRGKRLRNGRFIITSVTTRVRGPKRFFEKHITFGNSEKLDIYTALRSV